MVMLLLGVMAMIIGKLREPSTLPIRQVRIEGDFAHMSRELIEQTAAPLVTGGFFTIDLRRVESELEALPWVYRVALRRQWPDTLEIRVIEQVAIARWGDEALLNQYGELFAPPATEFPGGLPVLHGPEGKERELIERFLSVAELAKQIGQKPRALVEDQRRAWHLLLDNGVEVTLGRGDPVNRVERLVEVYPQGLQAEFARVARIDMRYTNGFAVAWKQGAAAGAQ